MAGDAPDVVDANPQSPPVAAMPMTMNVAGLSLPSKGPLGRNTRRGRGGDQSTAGNAQVNSWWIAQLLA